ncbi:sensor histidine kinase [Sphingomicrobium lutaoense]|uniref:histidine kinase n=1 Tax=Sphingomicrobium lutaoense TaxID=515949 RepID=A0A839Z0G3_9SPHN|nr:sensor histidine kinase [Sphingomicrobium lutaoense]MBB3763055.1 two-component sensor histidine kinase [Sphingomicrobium lutaoense]
MGPVAPGRTISDRLIQALDHEVVLLSEDATIVDLNVAARKTLGGGEPGRPLGDFADTQRASALMTRAIGGSVFVPINLWLANGRTLKMRGRGLRDILTDEVHLLLVGDQRRDQGFSRLKQLVDELNEEAERRSRLQIQLQEALDREQHMRSELVHRVKNNLALLVSMVQLRGTDDSPEVIDALTSVRERIIAIASVHDLLDQSGEVDWLDADELIVSLCRQIDKSLAPEHVRIETSLDPLRLHMREAVPVAILINELMTNSLKHAFRDRDGGCIRVTMQVKDGGVRIDVLDDGSGIPEDARQGSGRRLSGVFARQLHGRLDCKSGDEGTCWTLRFRPRQIA